MRIDQVLPSLVLLGLNIAAYQPCFYARELEGQDNYDSDTHQHRSLDISEVENDVDLGDHDHFEDLYLRGDGLNYNAASTDLEVRDLHRRSMLEPRTKPNDGASGEKTQSEKRRDFGKERGEQASRKFEEYGGSGTVNIAGLPVDRTRVVSTGTNMITQGAAFLGRLVNPFYEKFIPGNARDDIPLRKDRNHDSEYGNPGRSDRSSNKLVKSGRNSGYSSGRLNPERSNRESRGRVDTSRSSGYSSSYPQPGSSREQGSSNSHSGRRNDERNHRHDGGSSGNRYDDTVSGVSGRRSGRH